MGSLVNYYHYSGIDIDIDIVDIEGSLLFFVWDKFKGVRQFYVMGILHCNAITHLIVK